MPTFATMSILASARTGAPAGALLVVMTVAMTAVIVQRAVGTNAANAFLYPGTIGVLSLLVAYMVTNIGRCGSCSAASGARRCGRRRSR